MSLFLLKTTMCGYFGANLFLTVFIYFFKLFRFSRREMEKDGMSIGGGME